MAGPLHPAPAAEEADAAAGPAATGSAAIDPTGADSAADLTIHRDDADVQPTAQTVADVSSDSSSDEHPIPFPPFSEQDELEAQSRGAVADEQETSNTNTTVVSAPLRVTEPMQAETEPGLEDLGGPEQTERAVATGPAESTVRAESTAPAEPTQPVADPATEPGATPATELTTEPAAEPATEPSEPAELAESQPDPAPQTVASPPPAPPPPYWTHSHADPDRTASSTTKTALSSDRLLADPSRATTAASSAAGPVSAPAATSSSSAPAGASYLPAHQHRRDTSSSSSLLHVDLITLQDNEALEQMDHSSYGAGNGTAPGAASSSTAPSASADDRLRALHRQQRCWARRVDLTDYVVIGGGGGTGTGAGAGAGPRLGAFVVWTVRVETLEGTAFSIHKRYSEFDALRRQLVASFPQATASPGAPSVASLFGGRRTQPLGPGGSSGGSGSSSSRPASSSGAVGGRANQQPGNKKRNQSRSQSRSRKGAPPTALPPLPPKSVLGNFRPAFLEQRRLGLQYFLNCILLNPDFAGSPILRDFLFS